jgi:hypothetical protein
MANSYNERLDVLKFACADARAIAPARDAVAAVASDTADLALYGKLAVFNAGNAAEVIRVVPVSYADDAQHLDIKVSPGLTVIDWLIVRAIRVTGTGTDITAIVFA